MNEDEALGLAVLGIGYVPNRIARKVSEGFRWPNRMNYRHPGLGIRASEPQKLRVMGSILDEFPSVGQRMKSQSR